MKAARWRFLLLTICAPSVAPGAHAAAPEAGMEWGYTASSRPGDAARLAYGIPGTDAVTLMLDCAPHTASVLITSFADKAPHRLTATLSAGRAISRHRATAEDNEAAEGVIVETRVAMTDPALAAIRHGGVLVVSAAGERTVTPPLGRRLAAQFFGACGSR